MSDLETLQAEASQFKDDFQRILQEVHKVIVGQERVVECAVTALLAGGNVLLEGVPGLGKTELVKTLGHVLDLEFRRIQFTPDLMPADIIGTNVMNAGPDGAYRFEFRRGPILWSSGVVSAGYRRRPGWGGWRAGKRWCCWRPKK